MSAEATRVLRAQRPPSPTSCAPLFLFEALSDEQLDFLAERGAMVTVRGRRAGLRRGRAGDLLLRAARGRGAADPDRARRRRRGAQPHLPPRCLRRRDPGLHPQRAQDVPARHGRRDRRPALLDPGRGLRRRRSGPGSRWPCTCSRACSSACGPARPWSASASASTPSARSPPGSPTSSTTPPPRRCARSRELRTRVAGDAREARLARPQGDRARAPAIGSPTCRTKAIERAAQAAAS